MSAFEIVAIDVWPVDIALREPFGIATGAKTLARNYFVAVRLRGGAEGFGEGAPFEAVNGEDRDQAMACALAQRAAWLGRDVRAWRALSGAIAEATQPWPSARCALETALIDALCRGAGIPMAALFGGQNHTLVSDITVTTGEPEQAHAAAKRYHTQGYATLKIKVGGVPYAHDLARLRAIAEAAPGVSWVLDGNAALSADEALVIARACREMGANLQLFEQPCARTDYAGARRVHAEGFVDVCADESAGTLSQVRTVIEERAAQVVNLKITKSGVVQAHDIALFARGAGLELMIGGMVESSLAMSASAHLAAGIGGVSYVDLDTPLWLLDEPVRSAMTREGPRLSIAQVDSGHGAEPTLRGAHDVG